ncbi:MAG: HDOD domain-containing protein [Phycisphaerae bacterium]|jgi:HD-like signal output (HDOD) protein|nr:HDOD domain-containing protein [Phycisphaerae bacterium]
MQSTSSQGQPGAAPNAASTSPAVPAMPGMSGGVPEPALIAANAVKGISHIATLPEITLSIIELVENPKSTSHDLNKVISNDPALCSRILKVVNSAFYGLPRQIGSIDRAISLLGLNAVKNLAIAASLAKLFKGGSLCNRFDAKDLWTHSVATAAACRLIATTLKVNFVDEAFLAGLIHDIGIMVELQSDREKLATVFNKLDVDKDGNSTSDFIAVERSVFGCDHCLFGATLCETWKFPKSFVFVCGHHHDPKQLPYENRTLPWMVYIADRLSAAAKKGFRLDVNSTDIPDEALAAIGMSRDQLAAVQAALPAALSAAEATMGQQ